MRIGYRSLGRASSVCVLGTVSYVCLSCTVCSNTSVCVLQCALQQNEFPCAHFIQFDLCVCFLHSMRGPVGPPLPHTRTHTHTHKHAKTHTLSHTRTHTHTHTRTHAHAHTRRHRRICRKGTTYGSVSRHMAVSVINDTCKNMPNLYRHFRSENTFRNK